LINNFHCALTLLDSLEDQRPLDRVEFNFRKLVKKHLATLLEAKRVYWKQRATIRWVKFGDENSKLFQAMATISFRRNLIPKLLQQYGSLLTDHHLKAGLLWNAFRDRLGLSEYSGMLFDLEILLQRVPLHVLDDPFSKEIDAAVKELPSDHATGPDGFNGRFFKLCWHIISMDFYRLCNDFAEGKVDLEPINSSFIALIRKKDNHVLVNDFRPISLLNYSLKLLTKLFANRLQAVILSVVHANQYGFIKVCTIHDFLAWAFQFLHICHKSKKEIILLKLEFEKAFDKVEHQVILDVLKHKGFSEKWVAWVKSIL
jgi:hypothetical protein